MPLSHENQMSLLKDILTNQQADCCGSVSECQQAERLIKSLLINLDLDSDQRALLTEVYEYCQKGIGTANLDAHITSHQDDLSQWIEDIDQF